MPASAETPKVWIEDPHNLGAVMLVPAVYIEKSPCKGDRLVPCDPYRSSDIIVEGGADAARALELLQMQIARRAGMVC